VLERPCCALLSFYLPGRCPNSTHLFILQRYGLLCCSAQALNSSTECPRVDVARKAGHHHSEQAKNTKEDNRHVSVNISNRTEIGG